MNGSTLALTLAAGLAALATARPEGRGSRANTSANDLTRIHLHSNKHEAREVVEKRFFDALESVAGEKQVLYIGPFVMVGDQMGGVYGNLEIGVRSMQDGNWGVHLGFIGVPREARRTGRGSKLLSIVTAAADAAGLPMDLDVDPTTMHGDTKAPVSKKDLRAWYGRFGFKPVKSVGVDYMFRPAKAMGSLARVVSPLTFINLGTFEGETEWDVRDGDESVGRISRVRPLSKYWHHGHGYVKDNAAPWQWQGDITLGNGDEVTLAIPDGSSFTEAKGIVIAAWARGCA